MITSMVLEPVLLYHTYSQFQGYNLVLVNVLWPDAYQITVGDELCMDIEITDTEITCSPPESKPFDLLSDNVRVMVSVPFY